MTLRPAISTALADRVRDKRFRCCDKSEFAAPKPSSDARPAEGTHVSPLDLFKSWVCCWGCRSTERLPSGVSRDRPEIKSSGESVYIGTPCVSPQRTCPPQGVCSDPLQMSAPSAESAFGATVQTAHGRAPSRELRRRAWRQAASRAPPDRPARLSASGSESGKRRPRAVAQRLRAGQPISANFGANGPDQPLADCGQTSGNQSWCEWPRPRRSPELVPNWPTTVHN